MSLKDNLKERKFFTKIQDTLSLPNLIELQTQSYNWFLKEGLRELLDEISPVCDFTGRNLELHLLDYSLEEPKNNETVSREKNVTYEAPLRIKLKLINKETGEIKEQEVFLGEFPKMTKFGTFIINGIERVVVTQLIRSSGVFFTSEIVGTQELFGAKIIPQRGAWLEIETNSKGVISVKIDRGRRIPITTLFRALGYGTDEELYQLFSDVNTDPERNYIKETIEKDSAKSQDDGLIEIYKKIRPGDLATSENAKALLESKLFDFRHYDLGRVGRYKINKRLNLTIPIDLKHRVLLKEDLVEIIKELIRLNNGIGQADDIDHLGNRRVRSVGELIFNRFRIGLLRVERIIKDRMSVCDPDTVTPSQLINIRPIIASMQEFFASSQLSQFMDQTNPLSELGHKRRLSAMGPGGLSRERAGFEVRDVHRSHYGRICPIETPEGPNIGLVNSLASYGRINEYGFIETPYLKVLTEVENNGKAAIGKTLHKDLLNPKNGKIIAKDGERITQNLAAELKKIGAEKIPIKAMVTNEVVYLDATEEDKAIIAQANAKLNEQNEFVEEKVAVRKYGEPEIESVGRINYMDVSSKQIVSITTALIPFLEHDDANRALMGSNMQRQAVPLVKTEAPLIGTGMEHRAVVDTGEMILAKGNGIVNSVSADVIEIMNNNNTRKKVYPLYKFKRSNQGTCVNHKPIVDVGQKVKVGQVIADGPCSEEGELALGRNLLVAFMPWEGYNYEDAIIISERLVHDDTLSSIHIEEHEVDARDTKLGPEEITRDIPNISEEVLKDLDERGIIRVGAEVEPSDILVGKVTPKGETELTAEERLLRAIFGEKAREVRDTSLKVPHGESGKVIDIREFSRDAGDELPPGVNQLVRVYIAQKRKIAEGDKLAGRHGNKGVISKILPIEDMPFLADGTPVDIVLNPLGVPSRMNIGQVLETHLGWAAMTGWEDGNGKKVEPPAYISSPVFDGANEGEIKEILEKAKLPTSGKAVLFDGRSGEPFERPVTIGYMYIMKLLHLVDDKIHARSTGPYSLVTQQPLGGKAQFGGQRFGEMEVWALEAYGAAHTLQEILTVKSDDVVGRVKAYEAIVKGENIPESGIPESFKVLVKEMQSLCLNVEVLSDEGKEIELKEAEDDIYKTAEELGIDLKGRLAQHRKEEKEDEEKAAEESLQEKTLETKT